MSDHLIGRVVFIAVVAGAAAGLRPFGLPDGLSAMVGAAVGAVLALLELRLRRIDPAKVLGGLVGLLAGTMAGSASALLILQTLPNSGNSQFLAVVLLWGGIYMGVTTGAIAGSRLRVSNPIRSSELPASAATSIKILDTSVIIDGRVADIIEAGFIDGTIVIPRFILDELQQVADSADALRRNRGRRGLDILQRIQSGRQIAVEISTEEFPQIREVDRKLIELAKARRAMLVTNDFNLNKVASVEGVGILNINELANALRPVVLPGETMRVLISREGKEANQGVAYLDDGTMVVVDNARRHISKTVDITVTSVLQTTAGKMIFGKYDERAPAERRETPSAAGSGPN